ncbi:hypothetical protein [Schlesneria sp. T3-172]|uniref:hypothetical protein n=1 Tax=Schlesneria sphaerica TaxID=3373610 RepID=UPI0037CC9A69
MRIPAFPHWTAPRLGIALVLIFLTGCDKTDLSEYHPAGQEDKSSAGPSVKADNASQTESEAVTATPAPETQAPGESEEPSSPVVTTATPDEAATDQSEDEVMDAPAASALVPVNVVASVQQLLSVPNAPSSPTTDPAVAENSSTEPPTSQQEDPPDKTEAKTGPGNEIQLLIKEKQFQTDPRTGALRLSFDDLDLLKVLNMEPVVVNAVDLMPDWLKGLDGKQVKVRGFMYPTYETEGIERFVLARDNQICCFGRDPKIYDLIQIDMKAGKTTRYIPATRSFDVLGTLRIKMVAPDGTPYGLYFIEHATVIDR